MSAQAAPAAQTRPPEGDYLPAARSEAQNATQRHNPGPDLRGIYAGLDAAGRAAIAAFYAHHDTNTARARAESIGRSLWRLNTREVRP